MFSCKFPAYIQNTFSQKHFRPAASNNESKPEFIPLMVWRGMQKIIYKVFNSIYFMLNEALLKFQGHLMVEWSI